MRGVDNHDAASRGLVTGGDVPGEPDGAGDDADNGDGDDDGRVPILEGHAVWFNEYRY